MARLKICLTVQRSSTRTNDLHLNSCGTYKVTKAKVHTLGIINAKLLVSGKNSELKHKTYLLEVTEQLQRTGMACPRRGQDDFQPWEIASKSRDTRMALAENSTTWPENCTEAQIPFFLIGSGPQAWPLLNRGLRDSQHSVKPQPPWWT